jgi:protein TonB
MIVRKGTVKRLAGGVASAAGGTTAVLGLMLLMNGLGTSPEPPELEDPANFEVSEAPEPPKTPDPPPKQETSSEPMDDQAAPPPEIGAGVSSVDFEMPGFSPSNVEEASDELVGDVEASVMTADSVDKRPEPVRRVDPELPRRIVDEQIEGRVVVRALVDQNGRVSEVEVVEATPPDTFEPHVLEAVKRWEFQPASYEGEAVKTWIELPFEFELG